MFRIRARTIAMLPFRTPAGASPLDRRLVAGEAQLRKAAYRNAPIVTGAAFFSDSDMHAPYFLIVVYERRTKTPLLTARYYTDAALITEQLHGSIFPALSDDQLLRHPHLLIDRLSANVTHRLYRRRRKQIHLLLYAELLRHRRRSRIIAMARHTPQEKLLTQYLRLGLDIIGNVSHQGKPHWVLRGDLRRSYAQQKQAGLARLFLRWRMLF